jgi:uncharacterized protein YbgA (DUF1722 family)/uncharacterized protein YbbK (DUF523 family)
VGVSACLLGQEVRWNGAHKRDPYLVSTLGRSFEWVPVCPEVELGLGIPREPIRLEGDPAAPRLVARDSRVDLTERMETFVARRVESLAPLDLCGYILKSDSPTCGMERVRVHGPASGRAPQGVGIFARALMRRLPLLPVEEEGRLHDPALRESFIERVFALRRLRDLLAPRLTAGRLVAFHARHKLQLMSHAPEGARRLGRIVAAAGRGSIRKAGERYALAFMETLRVRATPRKHANVLQHILGSLKRDLPPDDKREILDAIEAMRNEHLPLAVPVALLRHHLRRHPVPYLVDQVYLDPHPNETVLRRHV